MDLTFKLTKGKKKDSNRNSNLLPYPLLSQSRAFPVCSVKSSKSGRGDPLLYTLEFINISSK